MQRQKMVTSFTRRCDQSHCGPAPAGLSYLLGFGPDWVPSITTSIEPKDVDMSCRLCQSEDLRLFGSEINIHVPGFHNLTRSIVASPTMKVCLRCGFTEFQVNQPALRLLSDENSLLENHPSDR